MARTLSSGLQTKAVQQYGSEPIVVVKVAWSSGTKYYTDKPFSFGANTCEAKIVSLANIVSQIRLESSSDVGSASVSLDDTSGAIKTCLNSNQVAGTAVTIYQTYVGLAEADALTVLTGRVANDITWSEGQRVITFTVDTAFNVSELGYAPKSGDLANLSKEAYGKLWPIVFGSVIKVPAVQIYKETSGSCPNDFENYTVFTVGGTFYITGGEDFPQNTSVKVLTKYGQCLQGTFSGNMFTVTSVNVPYHVNLTVGPRVVGDPDEHNPYVCWLANDSIIYAKYCYIAASVGITNVDMSNYCNRQVGRKCWFVNPWMNTGNQAIFELASTTISETSHWWRNTYPEIKYGYLVKNTWIFVPFSYYISVKYKNDYTLITGLTPTYIVNYATTTIKGVYAYRTYLGKRTLEPVPSAYYTKLESTTIGGKTVAAITMSCQLSDRTGQGWEDDIFVTQVSSLSSTTTSVISYLLSNYTSYTADSGSFNTVAAKIANAPSHFALLEQSDVLGLVADICFQARLAISYNGSTAKLMYLSETPTTVLSLDDETLKAKTLEYGFTSLEDIITKYTAKWRSNYAEELRDYTYKSGTNIYGIKEEERQFFIYNIESLVKASADFWAYRLANTWRTVKLSTFLSSLAAEVFDCVKISTPTLLDTGIRGEVISTSLDTVEDNIVLEVKLASKSGVATVEDMTYWNGVVLPVLPDPTTGIAEVDYVVPLEPKVVDKTEIALKIVTQPEKIVRGQSFTVAARAEESSGTVRLVNGTFSIALAESNDIDTIAPTTITFAEGLATGTFTCSGGSLDTECVINIVGQTIGEIEYSTALSNGIPITSEPTLTWSVDHTANARESNFTATFSGGVPSTLYTLTLDSQDPNEKLYSSGVEVTSFTTNGSGAYVGVWNFAQGTFALNSVTITATHGTHDYPSPEFLVIEPSGSAALVVEATVTGAYPGDVVTKSGASWVIATAPTDGATLGVVGLVKPGDICLIVCRGLICYPGLTDHTDYNCVAGSLSTSEGPFVLRSYENDLCWVGGGTALAKLTDIRDVDNTITLANQMILVYSTTGGWIPTGGLDFLDGWFFSTDSSILIDTAGSTMDIKIAAVALDKIAAIASNSILANVTGSTIAPAALTAGTDGHVLRRSGATLGFGTIGDSSISAVAWGKITGAPTAYSPAAHAASHGFGGSDVISVSNAMITGVDWSKLSSVPSTFTPAAHVLDSATHTISGKTAGQVLLATGAAAYGFTTVTGDISISGAGVTAIGANKVLTAMILAANVTNAKLANMAALTLKGNPTASAAAPSDITAPSTVGHVLQYLGTTLQWAAVPTPMTTAGDLIVGGTPVGGVAPMTRLAGNGGNTVQILRSVSGVTSFVTYRLDSGMQDVVIATPADGQVLTYETSTGVWKNKVAPGFANPMTTDGDIIYRAAGIPARLAANDTVAVQFLRSVSGTVGYAAISTADISNILVTTPAEGNILAFNYSSGLWKNVVPLGLGITSTTACAGDDYRLSDARTALTHQLVSHTASGLTAGQVLLATGATAYAFTPVTGDISITGAGLTAIGAIKGKTLSAAFASVSGTSDADLYIWWDKTNQVWTPFKMYHTNTTGLINCYDNASLDTDAKTTSVMAGTALTVFGRSAATNGLPAGIEATTNGQVLQMKDGILKFETVPTHTLASHTASGLTAGHVLMALNATAYGFTPVTGDITLNTNGYATISVGCVTNIKLANMVACSVKVNDSGAAAAPIDLQVTTHGHVLTCVNGNSIAWAPASITSSPMTAAMDMIIGGTPISGIAPMVRLAAPGSDGQILCRAGGAISWLAAPTADGQVLTRSSAGVLAWATGSGTGLPANPTGAGWVLSHNGSSASWDQTVALGNTSAAGSLTIANATSATAIVISPTLINAAGKVMSVREIDVCDAGVAKKMLVLASAPY